MASYGVRFYNESGIEELAMGDDYLDYGTVQTVQRDANINKLRFFVDIADESYFKSLNGTYKINILEQ